jgi:PKD repeat protein
MRPLSKTLHRGLTPLFAASIVLPAAASLASSADGADIPPAVDPGTPTYTGEGDPVPDEPVAFDPSTSMLETIFDADTAAGGDSFWIDRILERPAGGSGGDHLYTKGRALYMYTHDEDELGFAGSGTGANQGGGGFAYREAISSGVTDLYTVEIDGEELDEDSAQRAQFPSHWTSVHTSDGLSVRQRKFITYNNVAVTILEITNTGDEPTTRTLVAETPGAVTQSTAPDGTERTGSFTTRYNLTRVSTRFSGEGFTASGDDLVRQVTLDPGETVTVKLQLGAIAAEIPESGPEYEQYKNLDAETAFRTHVAEYNRWWVENVPYIDVPDENIKKMSYYRTFLNRFNYFDANIPGNDFQYPVSIEGVLGYNNAIQLTQPMHMQDLKWFRNASSSYGNWLSSGDTNQCTAFHDNPGSFSWGQSMEQYIAREGWNAYKVHGGDEAIVNSFAHYAECDVEGQLAKFDTNDNFLVEYTGGLFTGNDADTPTFHWAQFVGQPTRQDRAESAYQWAGARAAAEAYNLLGDDAKAAEMDELASNIKDAVLDLLWDDSPVGDPPTLEPQPATRTPGQEGFGNAVGLNGPEPNQYVEMPEGIVSGLTDFTIATWVNWNGGQTWSRVFDFGTGTGVNMFLTPNAGGAPGVRFAITTSGAGGEQQVSAAQELPTGWQHVAVTRQGTTVTIWLNGEPLASESDVTLSPADLGVTDQNWIGRSQYADPLFNGFIDDFQIHDRALSQAEIESLMVSPGGTTGGGNVAWYQFDEEDGLTALDSSGNGRDATVATAPTFVGDWPGKVFKHRLVPSGDRVQWKDHQNFVPFIEGLVPNSTEFRQALRYYADADEFPIMPFYTANQRDKGFATAVGIPGSNNFSNINSTLQAQVFSAAIRDYPSEFITPGMYRALLEWLTWVQYVGGDNRLPNNNEFFFNWNPSSQTFGRSGIHHNILGAYNFMLVDDIVGMQPRLDDQLELWPIDVGWDHFAVDNLSYHGHDVTVVWDRPRDGERHYPAAPEGFSAYVDGARVFTVDRLARVVWHSRTGTVNVFGSNANVSFKAASPIRGAADVSLAGNDRIVDMFQKAGVDLTAETGGLTNLAEGRPVSASFTTTTPALRATSPEFVVDGFTNAGTPVQGTGGYLAPNTIWGACSTALPACGNGSPEDEHWLEIDLGQPTAFDTVKLYFFNDKDYNPRDKPDPDGNTYRHPSSYTIQYHDGDGWVDVLGQIRTSDVPQANYNLVAFPEVNAQRVRVSMTRTGDFGIGVKEIQIFSTGVDVELPTAPLVRASASPTSGLEPLTVQFTGFAEDPQGGDVTVEWDFGDGATSGELSPEHTYSVPGSYTATLTATDSDGETGSASVDIVVEEFDGNYAQFATATCSYTSPWENCQGINSGVDPTTSNPGAGVGWGTWPNGGEQWMQLNWDEPITTNRTEIFWYDDGGGVRAPGSWILQYWDGSAWVAVPNPSGYGTAINQYNVTTHDAVTTTAMRVTVQTAAGATAVGALQWKVFLDE